MVKFVCRYLFPSLRFRSADIGDYLKNALILGSESVNTLLRGVVAAVRVIKSHSKFTPIVLVLR